MYQKLLKIGDYLKINTIYWISVLRYNKIAPPYYCTIFVKIRPLWICISSTTWFRCGEIERREFLITTKKVTYLWIHDSENVSKIMIPWEKKPFMKKNNIFFKGFFWHSLKIWIKNAIQQNHWVKILLSIVPIFNLIKNLFWKKKLLLSTNGKIIWKNIFKRNFCGYKTILSPTASLFLIDYYATLYYAIFFDRVLERSITWNK